MTTEQLGLWLSHQYPAPWRRRHGADLDQFVLRVGVRSRDLFGLVVGMLDAYVQVLTWRNWWQMMNRHLRRGLVLSAGVVVLLIIQSATLAKSSEDGPVALLTRHDGVARLGLTMVEAAAALAVVVAALASGRAVVRVIGQLVATGDAVGLLFVIAPGLICAALLVELWALANYVDWRQSVLVALLALSGLVGVALALWCYARALRRAGSTDMPTRATGPAAALLAVLGIVCLIGQALWLARVATLPMWQHVAGIVSLPMPATALMTTCFTLVAIALSVFARREIRSGTSA